LCEAVSQIDLISSLAVVSSLPDYVKPSFGPIIKVKAGKHPILTNICQIEPVPNDIVISSF
jgi:DNA mismatch repair ATPase MutS